LHALVNNAAVSPKDKEGGRLGVNATSLAAWQRVFQVNFFAPLLLAQGLQPELLRAVADGGGAIVNVSAVFST
jgi:NAD(P)-dependent dehydrogenase (short-subunit alcohol dehydrogenase family)